MTKYIIFVCTFLTPFRLIMGLSIILMGISITAILIDTYKRGHIKA